MTEKLPHRADGWAFFIDFDGTLVDIAETPDAVVVPANVPSLLTRVAEKAEGALAVVSGRTIDVLDRLLAPAQFAAAGVHGAELRLPGGTRVSRAPTLVDEARHAFASVAVQHPGLLAEDKGMAVALHFRAAPELEGVAIGAAEAVVAASRGALALQRGKMVVELRPAIADKGRALATLMEQPPFRGRRPFAAGDDLTDESMFATARALGGIAARVGPYDAGSAASVHIAAPASLRAWLAALE